MSGPISTRIGDSLQSGKPPRYVTSHPGQLSLLPSTCRDMSTSQSAVMLCSWGVKAGMVHSTCGCTCGWQVKLCNLLLIHAIHKCHRDESDNINVQFTTLLLYFNWAWHKVTLLMHVTPPVRVCVMYMVDAQNKRRCQPSEWWASATDCLNWIVRKPDKQLLTVTLCALSITIITHARKHSNSANLRQGFPISGLSTQVGFHSSSFSHCN